MKRRLCLITALCAILLTANAAINKKFFRKAQEKVWATELADFNPKTEIPDSLYSNESAVIIAAYTNIEADKEAEVSLSKSNSLAHAVTNAISCRMTTRIMVKLNDAKAVEEFSNFSFDTDHKTDFIYTFRRSSEAFGGRIHKPDGSIIEVDCNEAFAVTEGKRDKTIRYKIAIPGLEPGDVFEYFYYEEIWLDEFGLSPITIPYIRKYPMMVFVIDFKFDDALTVECRYHNGAPVLMGKVGGGNYRYAGIEAINIPKLADDNWMEDTRQVPFMRVSILNNTSRLVYSPPSARRGGLYANLPSAYYYTDVAHVLSISQEPTSITWKAGRYLNRFKDAHPEATPQQIVDAAWLATIYASLRDKDSQTLRELAISFQELIRKQKLGINANIGIVNSRKTIPVSEILSWMEPTYMNMVGDSCYMFSDDFCFCPGEYSGLYYGEEAVVYTGDRENYPKIQPTSTKLAASRASQNTILSTLSLSLDPNDYTIAQIDHNMQFSGATKRFARGILDRGGWINEVEQYLCIPEKDRYDSKVDSTEIKSQLDKIFKTEVENMVGIEPREISHYEITSRGVVPCAPNVSYSMTCTVDGLVKRAGNNLLLSIGNLIGKQTIVKPEHRDRKHDIFREAPMQYRYEFSIDIPQGYSADIASVEALNNNTTNKCGMFYSQAVVESNKVIVKIVERYNRFYEPLANWQEFLAIVDAASAFSSKSLVLKKQ